MNKPVKKPVKFYWTKGRKKQLTKWKILIAVFFIGLISVGLSQTYTERTIGRLTLAEVTYAKEIPVEVIPETLEQMVERVALEENFIWVSYIKRLIQCESSWDEFAVNSNGIYGTDRGLLQWNSKYHPEITNEMAFDPEIATREAMRLIQAGGQKQWMCDAKI